ncbi:flagellar biosynthetic protein FliO [bacterium]|nr:flagellar biosynthetic protein FliO [bacterium]
MMRNNYATPPNPKHAITFAIVSVAILILPLFWSPLNEQGFTPLATATPLTVEQVLASTPTPTSSPLATVVTATPAASPTLAVKSSATPVATSPTATPVPLVSDNPAPRYHDPTMEFSGQLRRIVLSLLVTTLLITFTLKVAQKHIPALGGGQKPGSFMNILAREAISPTQSLALVKVGTKILLVGLSEQNMTTLSEFSEADLDSLMPKAPEPEARTAKSMYGEVLRHYLSIVPGMGAKK